MPRIVPSLISSSYSLPVRLSETLSVCLPPSTWPSARASVWVSASGLIALLFARPLRSTHFAPSVVADLGEGGAGAADGGLAAGSRGRRGAVAALGRGDLSLVVAAELLVPVRPQRRRV